MTIEKQHILFQSSFLFYFNFSVQYFVIMEDELEEKSEWKVWSSIRTAQGSTKTQ